jgi:Cys-tRNA(Pro)/Cys-tRNA(Cys) deacylase
MSKQQGTKGPKTNAMRVLDAHRVEYGAHYYPAERHSAEEVAELIGADPASVFKTLVVLPESGKGRPLLVMVPAQIELNLKHLGTQPGVDEKKLRMATHREAEGLTRLQVGGISALAVLQKGFRVYIDSSALGLGRVYVSGGQRGVNLSLAPADLVRVTGAVTVSTSREEV